MDVDLRKEGRKEAIMIDRQSNGQSLQSTVNIVTNTVLAVVHSTKLVTSFFYCLPMLMEDAILICDSS